MKMTPECIDVPCPLAKTTRQTEWVYHYRWPHNVVADAASGGGEMKGVSRFPILRMRSISAVSLVGMLFAVVLLAYPGRLLAQALSGITGTVTDSTGAVVADAKVTITNNATGVVRTVATSSAGTYTITDLIPGTYTVSVEKTGFQTALTKGVVVDPGGKYASADATLKTCDV